MIPYDKKSGKIWYNNELVDWANAKIHILNHGLHYASCVFERERVCRLDSSERTGCSW